MASSNGPDIDRLKSDADRKQREANDALDALDAVRRGKRHTSQQTAADVEREVPEALENRELGGPVKTEEGDAPRERGAIVAWSIDAPYGFATRDKHPRGRQVFLHLAHVEGECRLAPGTRVEFGVIETPKGLRAVRVSPLQ